MGLRNGTVVLENNFELWHKMFLEEKTILKNVFGDIALQIEHIGSTSVPNLKAKPIVDIAVGVASLENFDFVRLNAQKLYSISEGKHGDEILLVKEDTERTYFLIHVMPIESDRYKNTIIFRDILRRNDDIRQAYEDLKAELSIKYASDRKTYTQSKNSFIEQVFEKYNNY